MNNTELHAVVVLAHLMERDGTLSTESKMRADKGSMIAQQAHCNLLLMGWAYRRDSTLCISDAMASYLLSRHGFPISSLLIDRRSRDTVGDAFFSKQILAGTVGNKWIKIVTSDYHCARAAKIFEFVYGPSWNIEINGVLVGGSEDQVAHERHSTTAFRKTFDGIRAGDDRSIFHRLMNVHPFYNGEVYPPLIDS